MEQITTEAVNSYMFVDFTSTRSEFLEEFEIQIDGFL